MGSGFMANEKVLIVDDEMELAEIVGDYLKAEGYKVSLCFDGEQALGAFSSFNPQLVILDVMLPKVDGMEVCRALRSKSEIPVIMLSARSGDIDKILALGLGADDYMTKPFSPGELVARVKAQLRRYTRMSVPHDESSNLQFGSLSIDEKSYTAEVDGKDANLAAREFELLIFMAKHPGQVFTREQLFNQIWGFDEYGDINTVTVHIRKIREKLEKDPANPVYIKTVWGVGYKFDGDKK
jgi:DNA-binding response OmpR family regulator